MVYAIYDLFANLYKYDILNSSHQWLEDSSKEEKDLLNAEMILIIDSLCRLIEKIQKPKNMRLCLCLYLKDPFPQKS